ncbi:MAG: tRNA dihydrouridine synthase DusB [Negativicutes bacterium]|nr:tRNA dihydrouridine synthase DusB [Negativicutes bacterium]
MTIKPLLIGRVRIEPPVVLAPLAGTSDVAFRHLARRFGCGLVVSEMISGQGLVLGGTRTKELLAMRPDERPIAIQLFGKDPAIMAAAARLAEAAGADIIDFNCGCPVPKITGNGEGAALMRDSRRVEAIVSALTAAVKIPITVKMRSGWDENSLNADQLAATVAAAGAAAVTIHARTRQQFYSGQADWGVVRAVKQAVPIPVIGNGDIADPDTAVRRLTDGSCDGIMIGRAALGNPWLFRAISQRLAGGPSASPPDWPERCRVALEHLQCLIEAKGEAVAVREMRTHAGYYCRGLRNATRLRAAAHAARTAGCYRQLFDGVESGKDRDSQDL